MTEFDTRPALDLSAYAVESSGDSDVSRQLAAAASAANASSEGSGTPPQLASAQPSVPMRFRMMAFGGQLTLMMVGKKLTPEALANGMSVDPQMIINLMCGNASDVSVGTLDHIANQLGGAFIFGWMPSKQA